MSRREDCEDNALQENFFGHIKDHIMPKFAKCAKFAEIHVIINDYMDYYTN